MINLNIPIYRAKDKYSKDYFEGIPTADGTFIIVEIKVKKALSQIVITEAYEIDPTTLAIHFPDMLDSQGNKIFASLDIKGGSLIEYEEKIFEAMYLNGLIQGVANMDSIQNSLFKYSKVIGIQK